MLPVKITNFVTLSFRFICLLLTGGLFVYCSWKFIQDESTSLVDFQTYHNTEEDIYPSITLCLIQHDESTSIYIPEKLRNGYDIDNATKYASFLRGEYWDTNFTKVNYDDVTIELRDYVKTVSIRANNTQSEPVYTWSNPSKTKDSFPFYTISRQSQNKCFSCDLSSNKIPQITGLLLSTFEIEFKDIKNLGTQIAYHLHYPNQYMRSSTLDIEWGEKTGIWNGNDKTIWIDVVEVVRRRNTFRRPCNVNSNQDDDTILSKAVQNAGCKPPHVSLSLDYPICINKTGMKQSKVEKIDGPDFNFLKSVDPPCNQVQAISYTPQGVRKAINDTDPPTLFVIYNSGSYREVRHIRAFDVQSLVGNIGGYIGLFLGFAFWQAPEAVKIVINKSKHAKCSSRE